MSVYSDLQGKVAIVTASSKGLGKAIALQLARNGTQLTLCSRDLQRISETAQEIRHLTGLTPVALQADVENPADIKRIVERTVSSYGRVDILVNNAGGPPPGVFKDFSSDEAWYKTHETTLMSVVRMIRETLPFLKERGGSIVNVTSVSVKQPIAGLLLSNVYRAAVTGLAKTLSEEFASHNIRVNNAAPGRIATGRIMDLDRSIADHLGTTLEEASAASIRDIPLERYGTPEEFANAVVFLASSQSSYITGTTLQVDGGMVRSIL